MIFKIPIWNLKEAGGSFVTVFHNPKLEDVAQNRIVEGLGVKLGAKLGVKLGVNEAKIIDMIKENKSVTIVQIAKVLGISTTAVENNIAKLREKGILKREGSDKSGYWEVIGFIL